MKNTRIALGIIILTGFSQYCSAYTWNVINLTGHPATIKIKLAGCKGDGISNPDSPHKNPIPPSPDLKHAVKIPFTAEKRYQKNCCIAGVQVNGKDVHFSAISKEQFRLVPSISGPTSFVAGVAAEAEAAAIPLATAGVGAAFGITEAIDRCKSRDLIVATDGAYLVVEKKQEAA